MKRLSFILFLAGSSVFAQSENEIECLYEERSIYCRRMEFHYREAQRLFVFDKMDYRRHIDQACKNYELIEKLNSKIEELETNMNLDES